MGNTACGGAGDAMHQNKHGEYSEAEGWLYDAVYKRDLSQIVDLLERYPDIQPQRYRHPQSGNTAQELAEARGDREISARLALRESPAPIIAVPGVAAVDAHASASAPPRELVFPSAPPPECPTLALCRRFARSLDLLPNTFDPTHDRCYCQSCGALMPDTLLRGGKTYGLPKGWIGLGLAIDQREFDRLQVFENWHVAYHGTTSETAVEILRGSWELLMPGDTKRDGVRIPIRDGHIKHEFTRTNPLTGEEETFGPNKIFTSPSIKYCAYREVYCKEVEFEGRRLKIAFQVRQQPETYKVGPETVGAERRGETIDELFRNEGEPASQPCLRG